MTVDTMPNELTQDQLEELFNTLDVDELIEMQLAALEIEKRLVEDGPTTDDELWMWVKLNLGIEIPRTPVCDGHDSPFYLLKEAYFTRYHAFLAVGNRGGGKTFIVALLHWLNSEFKPGIEGVTFGATEAQSLRCYAHLKDWIYDDDGNKRGEISYSKMRETVWKRKPGYKKGSKVEVLAGCLPGHARLQTPEGNVRIAELVSKKLPGPVKSWDFEKEEWIWSEISAWHNNGKGTDWLKMSLEVSTLQAKSDLYCTGGHRLMLPDGSKQHAAQFEVGDGLCVIGEKFSDEQEEIFIGSMLGDGHVGKDGRFRFEHTLRQESYLDWKADAFSEFGLKKNRRQAKNTNCVDFQVIRATKQARVDWYSSGQKRIPDQVWDRMTPLSLAVWLMDDGYFCRRRIGDNLGIWEISALNFNSAEREAATRYFDGLGIAGDWIPYNREKDQWLWRSTGESAQALQAIVADYIDVSDLQQVGWKRWVAGPVVEHSHEYLLTTKIVDIEPVDIEQSRYDITVPPHANYLVSSGVLVSNTPDAVNGPHPQVAHADEVELMRQDTYDESRNMATSKTLPDGTVYPSMEILTSTRKSLHGRMQELIDAVHEAVKNGMKPAHKLIIWCIFEIAKEVPNCQLADEDDRHERLEALGLDPCSKCECHKIMSGIWPTTGKPRLLVDVCKGRLFRSRGYLPFEDILQKFQQNSQFTWEAQQECSRPETEHNYLRGFSEERHGIMGWSEDRPGGFLPDPANGRIFEAIDWGGCYDAETEVLTRRGWVKWPGVVKDDEFASLDPETKLVEWQEADQIIDKPYHGFMDRYKNKNIDLLVTSDHNMLVSTQNGKEKWSLKPSFEVSPTTKMLKSSAGLQSPNEEDFILKGCKGRDGVWLDHKINAEDWAAILGFWMAEGHAENYRVGFTNYDEEYIEEMEEILRRYFSVRNGIDFETKRGQLVVNDPRLAKHLKPLGKCWEKRLPGYAKEWSSDLIKIYLDWHMRGDGSRNRIYTSSKNLADDLQEISMYAGLAADVSVRDRPGHVGVIQGREIRSDRLQYVVGLKLERNQTPTIWSRGEQTKTTLTPDEWGRQRVYCAVLPKHHTLYVRRNGKAVWCGNTNPHAVNLYQLLDFEIEALDFYENLVRIKEGSLVCFDEIYKTEIGIDDLAKLVKQMHAPYKSRFGDAWKISGRFADPQGKSQRLDFKKNGLPCDWKTTRDFDTQIEWLVREFWERDRIRFVLGKAPMFALESMSWQKDPNTGKQIDTFNHCMSDLRYCVANIRTLTRRERRGAPRTTRRQYRTATVVKDTRRTMESSGPIGIRGGRRQPEEWRQRLGGGGGGF